jgi:hypothetical protein
MNDWSNEGKDLHYADRRNFYKVDKWSRDGLRDGEGLLVLVTAAPNSRGWALRNNVRMRCARSQRSSGDITVLLSLSLIDRRYRERIVSPSI